MLIFSLSPVVRQCLIVIAANLSGLGAGLCLGWPSPVLVLLQHRNTTVLERGISVDEVTWIASVSQLVCVIALLIVFPIIDRIGRKNAFSLVHLPKIIACFLFLFGTEVWHLMVARVCDGVSLAFYYVVLSTYTAEIADLPRFCSSSNLFAVTAIGDFFANMRKKTLSIVSRVIKSGNEILKMIASRMDAPIFRRHSELQKNIRGCLGTIMQTFRSLGIMGMLCIAPFLSYSTLHITYLSVAVVSALPFFFLPETPYFLYSKGRTEKSELLLNNLRKTKEEVCAELQMFENNNKKEEFNIIHLLKKRVFIKAMGITIFLGAVGPFCGMGFIIFYLQTILEASGTDVKPEISSLTVGVIQVLACFPPLYTTDRYGRRPILCANMVIMATGSVGMGAFFWCKEAGYEINSFLNILPTLCVSLMHFAVVGYFSIMFILIPELFLGGQRTLGVSTGSLALSLGVFVVTKCYSALVTSSLGFYGTFWTFSVISFIIIAFVISFVPETKGKMFDEIQVALAGDVVMNVGKN